MHLVKSLALVATAALLGGCGGGGSGTPDNTPPAPATAGPGTPATPAAQPGTFPLLTGYQTLVKFGATDNYAISGTCTGLATIVLTPAISAKFENIPGFSALQTAITTSGNCPSKVVGIAYYDQDYTPLGSDTPGSRYEVSLALPKALPSLVKVGDSGILTTLVAYSDSTRNTVLALRELSYVVQSDPATTTAIFNLVSKEYSIATPAVPVQLISTVESRFRIAADGTLTPTTISIQEIQSGLKQLYTKVQ